MIHFTIHQQTNWLVLKNHQQFIVHHCLVADQQDILHTALFSGLSDYPEFNTHVSGEPQMASLLDVQLG